MTSKLLDDLSWRYATKKFDPSKKLTESELQELLEAMRLTPSSYGLQPYKILVITNPNIRAKLREHAWNQPQVTDASHLLAICSYLTLDETYIDHYVDVLSRTRAVTKESLRSYREMMLGSLKNHSPESVVQWMKAQAYIALGILLSAAAKLRIDSCPMEGFDAAKINDVLGLAKENLTIVALCPVGFRSADDESAKLTKVRFPLSEITTTIS